MAYDGTSRWADSTPICGDYRNGKCYRDKCRFQHTDADASGWHTKAQTSYQSYDSYHT